jgi:hypothetical protein
MLASGSADTTILTWDATGYPPRERSRTVSKAELPLLWQDLASEDAAKAFDAVGLLTASPREAVSMLKERLKPVSAPDPKQLAALIADLDSDRFQTRQMAAKELKQLAELAEPALRDALKGKRSQEVQTRIEELLEGIRTLSTNPEPDRLRYLRALEILEHVDMPQSRQVLQTLAEGAPAASLTGWAKESLKRLTSRSLAKP